MTPTLSSRTCGRTVEPLSFKSSSEELPERLAVLELLNCTDGFFWEGGPVCRWLSLSSAVSTTTTMEGVTFPSLAPGGEVGGAVLRPISDSDEYGLCSSPQGVLQKKNCKIFCGIFSEKFFTLDVEK